MSDAAFRVYVCSMSYCAQVPEPTGYLTTAQARALVAGLGKRPAVISELVRLNAWEQVDGGYLIHDYEEYLERGSRDRVRAFRARKRAGNVTGNGAETPPAATETPDVTDGNVTVTPLARDGYPVPEPVPVPSTTGLRPSVHPPTPLPAVAVVQGDFAEGYECFLAELCSSTGRSFRGDAISRGLYADRRREGRSAADLEAAARGVVLSAHHMGVNKLQVPLNDPKHVLDSAMLDTLIGLGNGEIGITRAETAEERRDREWEEAGRRRAAEGASELQA
jgi:hypothetical protein